VLLGTFSEKGLHWLVLDQPDLAPDGTILTSSNNDRWAELSIVLSALQSVRTTIHPIPGRYPVETIVIRSMGDETQAKPAPLVTFPPGGPHYAATTAFSAANTAFALEGCG
jgi:acylaminoacyl-peptidase